LEIIDVLHKRPRNLRVVQSGIEVMDRVISVIPAVLVVHVIDAVIDTAEVAIRIALVNKRMLRPVAQHHDKASVDHRHHEDHHGRLEVHKAHADAKQYPGEFTGRELHIDLLSLAVKQVKEGIDKTHGQETTEIFQ